MRPLFTVNDWPKLAVYDIEADNWVDVTLVCHIDEYGNRKDFPTITAYVDWLFSDFQGDCVFAHAGGHYDHRFIIAEAHTRGFHFSTAISGNSIVLLTIRNEHKSIKFGDSYRLMPDSLKSIGKTVGLEKIDVDPSKLNLLTPKEVLDYCYRDCEVALKGLQLMRDKLTGAGADFAFTLASIAARYNRRDPGIRWDEFYTKVNGKFEPHPNTKIWDKACYEAYFGGRTELFRGGINPNTGDAYVFQGPIEWYDIVSSYPTSMREPLPLYYLGFFTPPKNMVNVEAFINHCGVTACEIWVPEDMVLACLPVKDKKTDRLTFPVGELSARTLGYIPHWTNIEIMEALKHGAKILKLYGQWRFEAQPFMRKFVDRFYKLRQESKDKSDEFGSYAYKILLNSSYGKFVETVKRKAYLSQGEVKRAQAEGKKVEATATQGVFQVTSDEIGPFRHTAAGAYITAYSRLRLFRQAMVLVKKGATLYYCDTDSLMVDQKIENTGAALGDWEHVGTLDELEAILPKVYRAKGKFIKKGKIEEKTIFKCKGMPVERKFESEDMPKKRWDAFKLYRLNENDELAEILGREGVTGFVSDIKAGSIHPRKLAKPLVRSLRSQDKKRQWQNGMSKPLCYPLTREGAALLDAPQLTKTSGSTLKRTK